MKAEKTIICRIWKPTKRKKALLIKEFSNANGYIRDQTSELYSATKQAMDKYIEKDKIKEEHTYPLFLRNDTFEVEKAEDTEEFDYWFKMPHNDIYGGIWLPIKPHKEIKEEYETKDSKVVWKPYGFELHLSVSKTIRPKTPRDILVVDLGERVMATTVSVANNGNPSFYGKNIRGVRRHYSYLRNKLQEKKLTKETKTLSSKEKRVVEDKLHKISNKIVQEARENDSIIVLGDLKGLGNKDTGKGKRMNRIVNQIPYYKLTRMIEYKAKEKGIQVVEINEAYSSKTCHRCGSENTSRPTQARFDCHSCGLENYNADLNGAKNILYRFLAYLAGNGAVVNQPKTKASIIKDDNIDTEKVLGNPFLTKNVS